MEDGKKSSTTEKKTKKETQNGAELTSDPDGDITEMG